MGLAGRAEQRRDGVHHSRLHRHGIKHALCPEQATFALEDPGAHT